MHISKLDTQQYQQNTSGHSQRPQSLDEFIGQDHITRIIKTAISSAKKNKHYLWHILLCGASGYGKTTLWSIIAKEYGKDFHIVTWYAINKPAEMISILTNLKEWDIIFIDEIHRLKPAIEELMYIAMEDFAIDMVMPDGWSVRVPLQPFTLIWATTKPEAIADPLKNRFIYNFHCVDYNEEEKYQILEKYINQYNISYDTLLIPLIALKVDTVPRHIHNFVIKIRDFLITHHHSLSLDKEIRGLCEKRLSIKDGWITPIHQRYLDILRNNNNEPIGLKTISLQLGINEDAIEQEIEPLLLKQRLINKTSRGRVII